MKYEMFKKVIEEIISNNDGITEVWLTWAKELERMDNPDNEIGDFKTAETFLGEFADLIQEVRTEYGSSVAQQIVQMASVPACPFPWEIKGAAEHFSKGGSMDDIPNMEVMGTLEKIPEYLDWVAHRNLRKTRTDPKIDRDEKIR